MSADNRTLTRNLAIACIVVALAGICIAIFALYSIALMQ